MIQHFCFEMEAVIKLREVQIFKCSSAMFVLQAVVNSCRAWKKNLFVCPLLFLEQWRLKGKLTCWKAFPMIRLETVSDVRYYF